MLGQGKDIIVAFTENKSGTIPPFNYTRMVFFIAIGFWVYVSWYSSRIIAYIKKSKQQDVLQQTTGINKESAEKAYTERSNVFDLSSKFLDEFPRIIGNGCFLVLELAVLQSPILPSPLGVNKAWIIFFIALLLLRFLNNWLLVQAEKPVFRTIFRVLLTALVLLIIVVSLSVFTKLSIRVLFALLVLFHVVFVLYINLRRVVVEEKGRQIRLQNENKQANPSTTRRTALEKVMDFFCVPKKEAGYFKAYLYIGLAGLVLYLLAINWLGFARGIGPFPFIILAFAVLLAFDNIVSAFSIKLNINFHFLLLVLALAFGFGETHFVRTITPQGNNNNYAGRPPLYNYLTAWLNDRNVLADTAKAYDVYFVMANGGASRSGYWTASVLGKIEDSTLVYSPTNRFSDHVFCLSGTSGGGVGVATFFSLLRDKEQRTKPLYNSSARAYLKQDYFTYTFARMLGPDFFNYIFHFSSVKDRAAALEISFEHSARKHEDSVYEVPFYDEMNKFPAMQNGKVYMPILFVNTTRMQDGNPGVVTNLKLDSTIFNNRVDVLKLLKSDADISITSGAILGARFPYLSPAGRIANNYFVDGGYFDNSGAGVVQEVIRGIISIAKDDSMHNGTAGRIYQQVHKLRFKVLHIVNSPVDLDSSRITKVAPIKNDLMAPLLTIVGAYDMQTTVNDGRLINFIKDINTYENKDHADYTQISLYKDATEKQPNEKEPSYAMNWFMSDNTLRRIDNRLRDHNKLNTLIQKMKEK